VEATAAGAPDGADERIFYMAIPGAPESLAERIAAVPATVRLIDLDWVLIEFKAADLEEVQKAFPEAHSPRARPDHLRDAVPGARMGAHTVTFSYDLRALVPHTDEELEHPFRTSRLADPEVRARVEALAGQVSEANIEAIIRALAESAPGVPSSRWVGRLDFNEWAVDTLVTRLEQIFTAATDTVKLHSFETRVGDADVTVHNIIAKRPGRIPGSGRYLLGGHYDAQAANTSDWDPLTEPAPGADDNGSGVAALLEAARILTQVEFDFDLEVVLFTAEEIGLVGSSELVETFGYGPDNTFGAIVLDMVGYNPRGVDSLTVVTNSRSEWLADFFTDAAAVLPAADALDGVEATVRPTFNRSDHGPFWAVGADAVLLIEVPEVEINNPNYHRVTDTVETLIEVDGFDRIRRVTELVVATVGQFANPMGSVRLTSSNLSFWNSDGEPISFAREGERVEIRARLINDGPAITGVTATATTTISPARAGLEAGLLAVGRSGNSPVGTYSLANAPTVTDTSFAEWGSGAWKEIVAIWVPSAADGGSQDVRMVIDLAADPGGEWQLEAASTFTVLGAQLSILDAHARPNPVRGGVQNGWLSFQLSERGDVTIQLFDALGRESGAFAGFFDVGRVEIPLGDIVGQGGLPSGLYIARIRASGERFGTGLSQTEVTFAVAR
jgi:hypothetical protein